MTATPHRPATVAAVAALVASCVALASPTRDPRPSDLRETVRVEQILLDVRAVDRHGRPIPDLGPDDFRVRIGGEEARIVAVDWIPEIEALGGGSERQPAARDLAPGPAPALGPEQAGRLFVLLFQRHTHPSRVRGMMSMTRRVVEFLDTLSPLDRVAVLVLDSHLELMADFTDDHAAIAAIVRDAIMPYRRVTFVRDDGPALSDHFDRSALRDVYSPEGSLLVIGEALRQFPGPKTVLYVGWGMGYHGGGGIQLRPEYGPARDALIESRTAVFTLDVTEADYHSLEGPLIQVAQETGGLYLKTKYSSYFAMDLVERMVGGRYVLACEMPAVRPGSRVLDVDLVGGGARRGAQVLHREAVDVPEPVSP